MPNNKPKRMVRVNRGAEGPKRRMKVSGAQRAAAKSGGNKKGRMSNRKNMTTAAQKRMGAEGPKRRSR